MDEYRIPQIARKYAEYDMIQMHTETSEYPEIRTRLLYLFLSNGSLSKEASELAAIVTSLVQLGLDTHDLVESEGSDGNSPPRSRQLKVLAGDYFSGRFYHLLARAGQVDLVERLSNAICQVNRLKMNMYLSMKKLDLLAEEYIQQVVRIKMELFLSFSNQTVGPYAEHWPAILEAFTQCEVLTQELIRLESATPFYESWGYWYLLQHSSEEDKHQLLHTSLDTEAIRQLVDRYDVRRYLTERLQHGVRAVFDKIESVKIEKLDVELRQLGSSFLSVLSV